MPFPNIKTSDLRNSAQIPLYNTESSIPVLNIDPIRQGPTFITPEEEIMGFDPNFGYFTHTIPEVSYGYRDQGADNYQPSDVYSPDPQEPPITGRWAGSLMNTMANNGMNHAGDAANLLGLFNRRGMNFTDDTGTINIGLTGLSANDKAGRSYSISTNGDLGYTQAFNNGKTSAGVTVNPLNKRIYGEFSLGGRDPVKEFTGIEGLPEDVNASIPDSIVLGTREVNTVPLSAGERYLNSMLPALMDRYTNAGKPNF